MTAAGIAPIMLLKIRILSNEEVSVGNVSNGTRRN